jgi:hypothetical protein
MHSDKEDIAETLFDAEDTVIDVASTSSVHLRKKPENGSLLEDGERASHGSDFQSSSISLLKTILGAGKLVKLIGCHIKGV